MYLNKKYIRVSHKTEIDKIIKLMFGKHYWNLKPPKLIISVSGGAEIKSGSGISKGMIDVICKGLVKVASSTGRTHINLLLLMSSLRVYY
jgi:hypothetical protein